MQTTTEPPVLERLAKFNLAIQCSPPSGGVDGDWPHIAYAVTLTRNSKALWTGPYKLGVGRVKIPKAPNTVSNQWLFKFNLTRGEEGMLHAMNGRPGAIFKDKALQASLCAKLAVVQKVSPTLQDVMYSLLMDSSAMDETFSSWCNNVGYDDDSIKAFETYQACVKIGQALSKVFTPAELQELSEIFQDY
jgi:hypothetical protein